MFKYFPHIILAVVIFYLLYKWWTNDAQLEQSYNSLRINNSQNYLYKQPQNYTQPMNFNFSQGIQEPLQNKPEIKKISNNDLVKLSNQIEKDNFNYVIINSE